MLSVAGGLVASVWTSDQSSGDGGQVGGSARRRPLLGPIAIDKFQHEVYQHPIVSDAIKALLSRPASLGAHSWELRPGLKRMLDRNRQVLG